MHSKIAEEGVTNKGASVAKGGWRWLVVFGLFFVTQMPSVMVEWSYGTAKASLGAEALWPFIRADFWRGGLAFIALAIVSLVLARTWGRYRFYNELLLFTSCILMLPSMILSLVLLQQCSHVFDPARATAPWPTADAYLDARLGFGEWPLGLLAGAAVVMPFVLRKLWRHRRVSEHRPEVAGGGVS